MAWPMWHVIELDAVGRQFDPYLTTGCVCMAAPLWCGLGCRSLNSPIRYGGLIKLRRSPPFINCVRLRVGYVTISGVARGAARGPGPGRGGRRRHGGVARGLARGFRRRSHWPLAQSESPGSTQSRPGSLSLARTPSPSEIN